MVNVVILLQRTLGLLDQFGYTGPKVVTHLLPLLVRGVVVLAIVFHINCLDIIDFYGVLGIFFNFNDKVCRSIIHSIPRTMTLIGPILLFISLTL